MARLRALSAQFNRSQRFRSGRVIHVMVNFIGLCICAIGVGVLVVGLGGIPALNDAAQALRRTSTPLLTVAQSQPAWWALYAAVVGLTLWLGYRMRRALWTALTIFAVGMFGLGVLGSITLAREFAVQFAAPQAENVANSATATATAAFNTEGLGTAADTPTPVAADAADAAGAARGPSPTAPPATTEVPPEVPHNINLDTESPLTRAKRLLNATGQVHREDVVPASATEADIAAPPQPQ